MPPPSRRRRWVRRVVGGLAIAALLAVVGVVVALASLDRPWMKRRLQAVARKHSAVDVDWRELHLRIRSGLTVNGLEVHTRAPWDAETPELLWVEKLELAWTRQSLFGKGPPLTALRAAGVELTIVRDADGRTSLSALGAEGAAPAPPVPPSRTLADALGAPPPVMALKIERVKVVLILRSRDRPTEELLVDGLALEARFERWRLRAGLGSAAAPLRIGFQRSGSASGSGHGVARLWADLDAAPADARLALDVENVAIVGRVQAPTTHVSHALHLDAAATFDAAAGRTHVTIRDARAADDAARVTAALMLPDIGTPLLEKADGTVDLVRVLALVPDALVPVAATRAQVRFGFAGLLLDRVPRLTAGGRARIEADAAGVRAQFPGGTLSAEEGHVIVTAEPAAAGATRVHASSTERAVRLTVAAQQPPKPRADQRSIQQQVVVDDLAVLADGTIAADGAISADATVRSAALHFAGPTRIGARRTVLTVEARELRLERDWTRRPLGARGQLTVRGQAASVDAVTPGGHAIADDLRATASARLRGEPPYALDADLPIARLRLTAADGRRLADGPARIALHATDVIPDAGKPARVRGHATLVADVGPLHATLTAHKQPDAIDYTLAAAAPNLAPLRLLAARDGWDAAWERAGLQLTSAGRVAELASAAPTLRHKTELRLDHAALHRGRRALAAEALTLQLSSSGTARHHQGDADLRLRRLSVDGGAPADGHLTARFDVDLPAARAHLALASDGAPTGTLTADLGFDRARRAVTFAVDGKLAHLEPLAPLMPPGPRDQIDLSNLEVTLAGKGALLGLVTDVDRDGHARLAAHPLATFGADATTELNVRGFRWEAGDRELEVPRSRWRAVVATDGARRTLRADLDADELHFASGDHDIDLAGVHDELTATLSDLVAGVGELDHTLRIRSLRQDLAAGYTVGNLIMGLKASRDRDGVIHIADLSVDNRAAGTRLHLDGGIDAGAERRSLSLKGELTQDLGKLWTVAHDFTGRGTTSVALRLDTGNFRLFHALAAVRMRGADVRLPRAGVAIETIDGEIPLTADVVLDRGTLRLLRSNAGNTYSELRFADQHPLLSKQSFVSVARIVTPLTTVAPLAGNLRVDDNIISVNQLEMGLRGGRVTGQCIVNWKPDDTTVQMHVRASNVEASHKEPFDGNAAVVISTRERTVEGRAEILRIGRRHLTDLLELQDPHHADPAANRVRRALTLGYPQHVRLGFSHGFANVRVTFGGLASLMRIDELRGIPMGPVIDRILAPFNREEEP